MVSIRLVSGGHSFSATTLQGAACNGAAIRVVIDTPRVTLVPAELFDKERAADYLSINGLTPQSDEVVVWSCIDADIIAVIAISRKAKESIESLIKGSIEWYTPLLNTTHSDEECCCIEISSSACYIRIYNKNGLLLAEPLNISNEEELLYYATQIFDIEQIAAATPIYISGDSSRAKILKQYFKRVICE